MSESHAWSWGHESNEVHTRILRLSLGIAESRQFFAHVDPDVVGPERLETAKEQRWFGDKSAARVRFLLSAMQERFEAFPNAVGVLRAHPLDDATLKLVCHWHVQLADPIYRRFAGELLVKRRATKTAEIDNAAVEKWVASKYPGRWGEATCTQFASKLLASAGEAGILEGKLTRAIGCPAVPDRALAYLLYLLRETRIKGTLFDNPYVASVGVDVRARLQKGLPGVSLAGDELVWAAKNLDDWSRAQGSSETTSHA